MVQRELSESSSEVSEAIFNSPLYPSLASLSDVSPNGSGLLIPRERSVSLRMKCASAFTSVRRVSTRVFSSISTCTFIDDAVPPTPILKTQYFSPDSDMTQGMWKDAFWTMVRSSSLEWSANDQMHRNKPFEPSSSDSEQKCSEFVRRDVLGRHVRPAPRGFDSDEDCMQTEFMKSLPGFSTPCLLAAADLEEGKLGAKGELAPPLPPAPKKKSSARPKESLSRLLKRRGKHLFRSSREETEVDKEKKNVRSSLYMLWAGCRGKADDDWNSCDLDSISPYDSNSIPMSSMVGRFTRNEGGNEVIGLDLGKRRCSIATVVTLEESLVSVEGNQTRSSLTGVAEEVVSFESGPLQSWIEEAIWEVETNGSEIVSL